MLWKYYSADGHIAEAPYLEVFTYQMSSMKHHIQVCGKLGNSHIYPIVGLSIVELKCPLPDEKAANSLVAILNTVDVVSVLKTATNLMSPGGLW